MSNQYKIYMITEHGEIYAGNVYGEDHSIEKLSERIYHVNIKDEETSIYGIVCNKAEFIIDEYDDVYDESEISVKIYK